MTNAYRVAIVGAGTLKGKELADLLNERHFPALDVKLLDDDDSLGQLESVGDEVTFIQTVAPEQFARTDFAFFTSEADFTRRHWRSARQMGSAIIDLSYALEHEPGVRVSAPWIEQELGQVGQAELDPAPMVVAHPAAVALALLSVRAERACAIRSSVATILEPASEHGRRGMDELHEQTVNLLSFQQMPTAVFDMQVAFNMVAKYGDAASRPSLETAERRVTDHFRRITGERVKMPSLMLAQAPIFHGHAFSFYIELEKPVATEEFAAALGGEHVKLSDAAAEAPSNVNVAGQDEIQVLLRREAETAKEFWLWCAFDNLRLTALTALGCAERLAVGRPKGSVQ